MHYGIAHRVQPKSSRDAPITLCIVNTLFYRKIRQGKASKERAFMNKLRLEKWLSSSRTKSSWNPLSAISCFIRLEAFARREFSSSIMNQNETPKCNHPELHCISSPGGCRGMEKERSHETEKFFLLGKCKAADNFSKWRGKAICIAGGRTLNNAQKSCFFAVVEQVWYCVEAKCSLCKREKNIRRAFESEHKSFLPRAEIIFPSAKQKASTAEEVFCFNLGSSLLFPFDCSCELEVSRPSDIKREAVLPLSKRFHRFFTALINFVFGGLTTTTTQRTVKIN